MIKKYNSLSLQAKAAIWYTICNLLQKGISLITVPIFTRLLTTEQYGSYSVFLSWLEIFEIFATFRLSWSGYTVGLTKYENDRDQYTSSVQGLSFTITSVVFLLFLCIPSTFCRITGMTFSHVIMIFVLLYTTPAIGFWSARQRVEYRYQAVVAVTLSSSILIPILGVLATVIIDQKETAIIGARVVIQGIIGLCLLVLNCHKHFCFFHRDYWKRSLRFNVPLLPYYLSTSILNTSDRILVQKLIGEAQAGIYGVAYSASMVMTLFNNSINSSIQPWLFERIKRKEYHAIPKVMDSLLILIACLNLMLIAFAPEAIIVLAPVEYQEAIWVVPPLAGSVFIMFFCQIFVNVEFYFEKSKVSAVATFGSALLNVILNLIFIPTIGYLAAGYTTLVSYIVFAVTHYVFFDFICKKNNCSGQLIDIKKMTLIAVVFFVLTAILIVGYMIWWIRYGFIGVVCSILIIFRRKIHLYEIIKK